jgi:integrase
MATIRRRDSDHWQVKIRRKGVRQSATFRNFAQAEQWARKIESEIDSNRIYPGLSDARATSLAEALEQYAIKKAPAKKGHAQALSIIKRWKASSLAQRPLSDIRAADIANHRDELAKSLSAQSIRHHLNLLSHLYRIAAKEWGYESLANPVAIVEKPRLPQGRDRRLKDGEEQRLLAACDESRSHWLGAFVRIALLTAMRQGEIVNLEWQDVDLKEGSLIVRDPKNSERRTVPLSPDAQTIFRKLRPSARAEGRIFQIDTGHAVTHAFGKVCRDHGFSNLRFHDLRHEATSRLFENPKLRDAQIAMITGHKTPAMLWRYTHLRVKDLVKLLA